MSDSPELATSDSTTLDRDSCKVGTYFEVSFAKLEDGRIWAQYSAPLTTMPSVQHSTAEQAALTGPRLLFKDIETTWNAVRDRNTKVTILTRADLEEAILRNVRYLTMVPPEISQVFTLPTSKYAGTPVYFRSNIPPNDSRGTPTPSSSVGVDPRFPGLRSWKTKTEAKKYINDLMVLDVGPAEYCLTVKNPAKGENPTLGSIVVSLNADDCEYYPGMRKAARKVDQELWTVQ